MNLLFPILIERLERSAKLVEISASLGLSDPDMSNYDHFVLEGYDGALWVRQQERLIGLRNLIQANGGHLLVVTFPFLHKLGPGYEYAPVHKKLGEFWHEAGIPYLDLLGVYEPHRDRKLTVGSHDAHPNIYAHTLAADAIRKFLEQNIRPRNPPKGS